jgi:hypothetical protein
LGMYCIDLVKDEVQWLAVSNIIANLWLYKAVYLLMDWRRVFLKNNSAL